MEIGYLFACFCPLFFVLDMARNSTQATIESDVTSPAAEESLESDDDTLRGKKYRECISSSMVECWTRSTEVLSSSSRPRS